MQQEKIHDVLIIGGGPAGLTAAIYTSRAKLDTLVIAGMPAGGQLMLTSEVENWPGYVDGIQGPELIRICREQAEKFGSEFTDENVKTVSGTFEEGFTITTEDNKTYKGRTVIVATGASAKWLNLPSEQRLRSRGVSACATCDGFFFKNKVVAVVGAGDSAMEEANFLTKFATKVYLIVRGDKEKIRASVYMRDKAMKNPKIEFVFNTVIEEVLGEIAVTGLRVTNVVTNETKEMLDVQGLFLAIGHTPNTQFLNGFIEVGQGGYIEPKNVTGTSKEGVFVAGDVSDHRYRQAITAAGAGCMAALDAEKFLASHESTK